MEILRYSVNELQRKQSDIHRHIGQLSAVNSLKTIFIYSDDLLLLQVMSDFEYHMSRIRTTCHSSTNSNNDLCQSLLSHLDSVILDTRSALIASNNSNNDAQEVQTLVHRLYEENQRIGEHIDHLIKQDQSDLDHTLNEDDEDNDHIIKAIELALEQNTREQERMNREQEQFHHHHQVVERFLQTTDKLHDEALEKIREHIRILRERNQSLKQYNEQIEILTKQIPQTLFLSPQ